MFLIVHKDVKQLSKVIHDQKEVKVEESNLCKVLWDLAKKFPEEIIAWCEKDFENDLYLTGLPEIFHHDLIMASYALKTKYLSDSIGYVDQMPFVNINRKVQYATWRMSADVGGIKGKTLQKFQPLLGHVKDFELLINSVAKLGQQNGLFCYSTPLLFKKSVFSRSSYEIGVTASRKELFSFVYSHYTGSRLWLLFWCFIRYESSFPIWALISALFNKKYFKKEIDFSSLPVKSLKPVKTESTIDVIIPTLGRKKYLFQVLEDLKSQSLLPKKVIVVEQNPQLNSQSELPELKMQKWPFELVHHFIHQTGACNARNMALDEVSAEWVFFADDDNKMDKDVLENTIKEINRLGLDLLTLKYSQQGEKLIFDKVKQWGTFGAGNSIVSGKFASQLRFDMAFEYGYGEDKDYGMQLRYAGCDIIYHPNIEILHLKAPRGGFREDIKLPWEKEEPKPSPTLMAFMIKHYTSEQLRGYKAELLLRFYGRQNVKNPVKYFKLMRERWRTSERWAAKLIAKRNSGKISETV